MRKYIQFCLCLSLMFLIQSCGIMGVHFKVHNPKKEGKLPNFDRETILLGELNGFRTCYDVHYYDFSLSVFPETKSLAGTVVIAAKALSTFSKIQIDLDQQFEILYINNKKTNSALPYKRDERAIFVDLVQNEGEHFEIEISYKGVPNIAKRPPWKGGFVWKKDKDKHDWIGVACESDGASLWWPLKDHTSDEPDSMRLHFTVPSHLVAVGNGQFEGKVVDKNFTTYNWFISYPINTYNVSIYVGNFKLIKDEYIGIEGKKLALSHYVLEKNVEKAEKHFKQIHSILAVYEEKFGPYPWYKDGFKLIESPYMGMEHQTAIAYGSSYRNDLAGNTDYIILHETAHEWWGNSITASDLADVWLQEGFATYAEALYLEETVGKAAYDNHLRFYKWVIKNKYPVVGVKDRRWFHFRKNGDVYVKGAWILHTLREQINDDELFFDILKSFSIEYKYKILDSSAFIDHVSRKTGEDFKWFFDQYLYNHQAPELEYALSKSGVLYYKWVNTQENFNKLKISFWDGDVEKTIIPSTSIQQLQLDNPTQFGGLQTFEQNLLFAHKERKSISK